MPSVENKEETITVSENGDHDLFAHIVPAEDLTDAIVNGIPVMALCGKIWIPSRDPEKYPKCKTCVEIYDRFIGLWDGQV